MSSQGAAVRRIVFCAIAASGLLGACGQSPAVGRDPGRGGSGYAGTGGAADDGAAGAGNGGAGEDGGRSGTMGGGSSGEGGAGGVAGIAGGAAGGASGAAGGAAGAAGGAAPVMAPPYFRAGTRLKPRVLRGGGLEVIDPMTENPWYDTGTGDWCVFRTGEDGVERCFPDFGVNENTDYLDSSCKKPVFVWPNLRCDGTPFNYVSIGPYAGLGCGSSTTYRLGAPLAAGTPLYSNNPDYCMPAGSSRGTERPLEKVPLSTFVAVQRVSRPALPNMDAWVREGADGSSEVIGFHNPILKTSCSALGPDVSSRACVPDWVEPSYSFADSTCTRRVAVDPSVMCASSEIRAVLELESMDDSCSTRTTIKGLWQVESARGAQLFAYDPIDLTCKPSSRGTAMTYVRGGADRRRLASQARCHPGGNRLAQAAVLRLRQRAVLSCARRAAVHRSGKRRLLRSVPVCGRHVALRSFDLSPGREFRCTTNRRTARESASIPGAAASVRTRSASPSA